MKIALIGYGAMGKLVEARAKDAAHEIIARLTSRDGGSVDDRAERLRGADAAIDFSVSEAVPGNVEACLRAGIPLVEGTTGWKDDEDDVKQRVAQHSGALVYGANFSVGVNLFYKVVERSAQLFSAVEDYEPFIEEAHHSRKRDAPSGTALRLRDIVAEHFPKEFSVSSTRAGHIPGTHTVGFDSSADQVTLTHMARSREGFAAGALLAAEWIVGRKGVYEFSEVLDEILKERTARR